MLELALWYASQGWRVLPLHSVIIDDAGVPIGCSCGNQRGCDPAKAKKPSWGKHPRLQSWQTKATTDESTIRSWWARWPDAQVGIATGPASDLLVLDVDGDDGFASLGKLEAAHKKLPDTYVVETGSGGLHFYFRWPAELGDRKLLNQAGFLADHPGLDWRVDRGQVAAPPSRNRAGTYLLANAAPPAELPGWLLDRIATPVPTLPRAWAPPQALRDTLPKRLQGLLAACCKRIETAPEGTRNNTLYSAVRAVSEVVGVGQSGDLSEAEAEAALLAAADRCGLSRQESSVTFRSAWKAGIDNPKPMLERPWLGSKRNPAPPPSADQFPPPQGDAPPPSPPPTITITAPPEDPEDGFRARMTDTGNAKLILHLHPDDLRYNPAEKGEGWMLWTGTHWQIDTACQAEKFVKDAADYWWERANKAGRDGASPKAVEAIRAFARRTENKSGIQGALFSLRSEPEVVVPVDQWNHRRMTLTAKNVSIDLETGKSYPHARADYSTRMAGVAYSARATCERWEQFLSEIMAAADGTPRPHLVEYLQRWCGYCATGSTEEQVFAILHGSGSNGKTTFVELLRHVLGDYATSSKSSTLMQKDQQSAVNNDIARLVGARLVTASETDQGRRLDEGLVKELVGGDRIMARFLHKEFFEFDPQFKLMLLTNNKPVIKGTDHGIWRRIHLVPFEVRITEAKKDKNLKEKLYLEAEGILAWVIEGARKWRATGLKPPQEVVDATRAYQNQSDVLGEFLRDCTRPPEEGGTSCLKSDLYKRYTQWCEEMGEHPIKQRTLTSALEERGWRESPNRNGGRSWEGYSIQWAENRRAYDGRPMFGEA